MAYSFTVDLDIRVISPGRRHYKYLITEYEATSTSEWVIQNVPHAGTISLYQAEILSGTGSTLQPKLGKASGWSTTTNNHIAVQSSAAGNVHDLSKVPYSIKNSSESPVIYGVSAVDAGADNSIETIIEIIEGHWGA